MIFNSDTFLTFYMIKGKLRPTIIDSIRVLQDLMNHNIR